jgi:hypothetical protein
MIPSRQENRRRHGPSRKESTMIRQTLARSAVGVAALAALAGGYAYLQKDAITPGYAAQTPVTASAGPIAVATPTDFSASWISMAQPS